MVTYMYDKLLLVLRTIEKNVDNLSESQSELGAPVTELAVSWLISC